MFGQFFRGIGTYFLTFDILSRYKLWSWVILPGLLSLLLGGATIWAGLSVIDEAADWVISIWPYDWGTEVVEWASMILVGMLVVILVLLVIKYLVIVLAAPFVGILSEKVEARLTGKPVPEASFGQVLKDILRGLRLALRNIVREILYTLVITVLGLLVPIVGQILSAILIFFIQAYYAGFGNVDPTLERRRYNLKESVNFASSYRWLMVGNGAGFLLLLLVPVLGLVLAPGLGTVAATIDGIEVIDKVKYRQRIEALN